jgi:hypothetical protein
MGRKKERWRKGVWEDRKGWTNRDMCIDGKTET